jgi:hypothetical protein
VRYVDAARSYGRAEAFLARWLARRGHGSDELTVGSKWGYTYTAGWRTDADRHEVKDHGAPRSSGRRRRAGTCSATTSTCTRSTPPRRRAACSTIGRCSSAWPTPGRGTA